MEHGTQAEAGERQGREIREGLRAALTAAMKARDRVAVAALRSTLAALENAEAVDRPAGTDARLGIGQIPVGVGAAEAERRVLTSAQVVGLVRAEVAEREAAAREYERSGHVEQAERLRGEAGVIAAQLERGAGTAAED